MAHIIMYARRSAPDVGGAYGGSDGVQDKHYKPCTRPPWWGLHGIMHSASDTIGPGGWGQRPRREPALQVWCV